MKYIKADNILPDEIIELIQQYIDGEYIYIPRKKDQQMAWGEKNGTKDNLRNRNIEIYEAYANGKSIIELTEEYFLSESSIRRIIREARKDTA